MRRIEISRYQRPIDTSRNSVNRQPIDSPRIVKNDDPEQIRKRDEKEKKINTQIAQKNDNDIKRPEPLRKDNPKAFLNDMCKKQPEQGNVLYNKPNPAPIAQKNANDKKRQEPLRKDNPKALPNDNQKMNPEQGANQNYSSDLLIPTPNYDFFFQNDSQPGSRNGTPQAKNYEMEHVNNTSNSIEYSLKQKEISELKNQLNFVVQENKAMKNELDKSIINQKEISELKTQFNFVVQENKAMKNELDKSRINQKEISELKAQFNSVVQENKAMKSELDKSRINQKEISELKTQFISLIQENKAMKQEILAMKNELDKSRINQKEISELKTQYNSVIQENKAMKQGLITMKNELETLKN